MAHTIHDKLLQKVVKRSADLFNRSKNSNMLDVIERIMDELDYPEDSDVALDEVATMVELEIENKRYKLTQKTTAQQIEDEQLKKAEKMLNKKAKQVICVRSIVIDGSNETWADDSEDVEKNESCSQTKNDWENTLNIIDLLRERVSRAKTTTTV